MRKPRCGARGPTGGDAARRPPAPRSRRHPRPASRSRGEAASLGKVELGARIGGAKGLDFAGARVDPAVGEVGFAYADPSLEANQAMGKAFVVRAAATGRWTRDRLPAAQRFSVGGATFGRASDDGLVNGDRGYAAFGELALGPLGAGSFSKSELYGFVDHADVTLLERPALPRTGITLGSWGGGVRLSYAGNATLGLEVADAWDQPVPGYDQGWRVALSWKLAIRP